MEVVTSRMDIEVIVAPSKREKNSKGSGEGVAVVLINDDDTTMLYVVSVLQSIFSLDYSQSRETMMMAHVSGSALIGLYPEKEALGLLKQVDASNSKSGVHLRCVIVDM